MSAFEGRICVILPTIREFGFFRSYLANARKHRFDVSRLHIVIVTENHCDTKAMRRMIEEEGVSGRVFSERDRQRWLQRYDLDAFSDLIPRRSHAETSFGLLYMHAHPEYEYGIFVDDDTFPLASWDFFGRHLKNLNHEGQVAVMDSTTRWVNVLHQGFKRHGLYPRGFPYSATQEKVTRKEDTVRNIVCSQGLWTNVPDVDAVRTLVGSAREGQADASTRESDFGENFVVAPGNYLTISSMNLAFRREIIPVFYQLPMDDNRWNIGRFDDIWSGVFLKRACDLVGKEIITGHPLCRHDKTPRNVFRDLFAEVSGLELNENLWKIIDRVSPSTLDLASIYRAFADALEAYEGKHVNSDFLPHMARKMRRWIDCLGALDS